MKANASAQGASFKNYVGVGSFRVINVNPTKAEMEEFFGRSFDKEPEYLKDMVDSMDNNKPYKQLRVTYLIQADIPEDINPKNTISRETNAALTEPYKTTITFFIDSRYLFNKEKTKVKVIDKYGRTAWVTIEQAKNHQKGETLAEGVSHMRSPCLLPNSQSEKFRFQPPKRLRMMLWNSSRSQLKLKKSVQEPPGLSGWSGWSGSAGTVMSPSS